MMESGDEPVPNQTNRATWCEAQEAGKRIGNSANQESCRRDLGLLAAASGMCLSPYRRLLLMVRELHRLGFERLRAPAYQYPLAWRCPIVPAYWTLRSHGGRYEEPISQIERWFGTRACQHGYSSAEGQFPFEWTDAAFLTPKEMALRFIREQREIACAGLGPDAEYARWFEEVLEATKPNGLYYAFAEYEEPTSYLYTHMASVDRVPLPPPGYLREGELSHFGLHVKWQTPQNGISSSCSSKTARTNGCDHTCSTGPNSGCTLEKHLDTSALDWLDGLMDYDTFKSVATGYPL